MKEQKPLTRPPADFPFESRFVTIDGYKIHYVEEGKGDPVLFIHGNPTSSYIWRNVLPGVAADTGRRGIALDLLGFGKSDKPDVEYTLQIHERIVEGFIEQLRLKNIIMVLQDWGGPLGAYYAVHHPENVQGVALMETFIGPLRWEDFGKYRLPFKVFRSPAGFVMFQVFNMFVNTLIPGFVLDRQNLTKEVMRHYQEPFPTIKSRRAVRVFPKLIPVEGKPEESYEFVKRIKDLLPSAKIPFLLIKATPGGIVNTEKKIRRFIEMIPLLEVKEFGPGVHYLQEENPEKIARLLVEWIREKELAAAA